MDPNVSQQFGLSGFLDGVANLGLFYGASAIKAKFPEQSAPQNPNYNQDNAINQALAQQALNNRTNWPLIAIITVVGGVALFALVRK